MILPTLQQYRAITTDLLRLSTLPGHDLGLLFQGTLGPTSFNVLKERCTDKNYTRPLMAMVT